MTNIQPCPSCVETIADLRQAVSDAIHNAYVSGALDVHNNYQEDRDPSFGEAAADYVASLDVNDMLAHFLPKSPAQLLAEECPHGMTPEAAQWVLDHFADAVKPIEATCKQPLQVQSDSAPRYVFGPWVEVKAGANPLPDRIEYQDKALDGVQISIAIGYWPPHNTTIRRAYRIGKSHPHDGGACPLEDGSVGVRVVYGDGAPREEVQANSILWDNVTRFTILDGGLNNG